MSALRCIPEMGAAPRRNQTIRWQSYQSVIEKQPGGLAANADEDRIANLRTLAWFGLRRRRFPPDRNIEFTRWQCARKKIPR